MNDEQYTPSLGTWLKATEISPPDPRTSSRQIMDHLPERETRRSWRPFHRQTGQANHTSIPTTEFEPTSIPATDGRFPIVIGRTYAMLSPVKAITAGAIVFALGGIFLITQPFDQGGGGVPGASVGGQGEAARVTANQECSWDFPDEIQTGSCTYTASDPRVSGALTITLREAVNAATSENDLETFDATLTGSEGAWTGRYYVVFDRSLSVAHAFSVLTGDGAYKGWTYVTSTTDAGADGSSDLMGVLYQGDPPAAWETPMASE